MGKDSKTIVEPYLKKTDWRVRENSNSPFTYGGLSKYISGEVCKDYWLREVFPEHVTKAYLDSAIHPHDLGGLTIYCCGYSLKSILMMGVQGVPNIPSSYPAKHFDSILNQLANLVTVFQNEIMGAVAFNNVDTYLAPFIKADGLSYKEIKQQLQNFIFSINSNSRGGAEPAFTNITLDLTPSSDMLDEYCIVGGELTDFTYKDCQKEIDMFNRAFCELMIKGDSLGRPFAYPIPTYNIYDRFDWDNPNNDLLWQMAGKYGYPYFANYIGSDLDPSDVRSMCCRLRLDLTELKRRNGGLFGSGDSTGSVSVTTINLPQIGYLNKGCKESFFTALDEVLVTAKDCSEVRREWLQKNVVDNRLLPAFCTYVGTLDNHFSTIGLVGMNECCENFFKEGVDILSEEGKSFCLEINEYIRNRLVDFQKETGHLYNLEATPAESTCFSLALKDRKKYPDIITRGTEKSPYYTNSCHIPVAKWGNLKQVFDHQEELQVQFTGGTVIHIFTQTAISKESAKEIVKAVCENYKVPYVSISPLNRYCPVHGYVEQPVEECPICNKPVQKYQRITGYLRCVDNYNDGKKSEFNERTQLNIAINGAL